MVVNIDKKIKYCQIFNIKLAILFIFVLSLFAFANPAKAILYAPGATLNPACFPTDVDCDVLLSFPTFTYASTTFASTSWVTATFVPYTYATNTFVSFTYATNTFQTKLTNPVTGTGTVNQLAIFNATSGLTSLATGTAGQFLRASSTSPTGFDWSFASSSGSATWGAITGLLSDQTDLQNALNAKLSTTSAAATYVSFLYASSTFPSFTYATNTFATLANSVSYTYASSTFPSFTYASTTFASTSFVTGNFPTFTYASSTFPTFSYASNTFALFASSSQWITNGTSIYYSTGNVGIGSSTPGSKLSVVGTAGATNDIFAVASSSGATYLVVKESGRVGIGTTTPNNLFQAFDLIDFVGSLTRLGYRAGKNVESGTTGNTFVGYEAGFSSSTGSSGSASNNTAIGYNSLHENFDGIDNVAVGASALRWSTSGYDNTTVGNQSMFFNTTGFENVALGLRAMYQNLTGSQNIAIGVQSLTSNSTGTQNIAIGYNTLFNNRTSRNIGLGVDAGNLIASGAANLTPSNSIFIGYDTRALNDADTNEIVIGDLAIGAGSNSVTLGNNNIASTILKGLVGIGTTTPNAKLTIYGTSSSPTLDLFAVSSSSNARLFTVGANGSTTISNLIAGLVRSTSGGSLYVDNTSYVSNTYASSTFPSFNYSSSSFALASTSGTIGGEVYGGTSTAILFVDSSGNLAQDTANFSYDPVLRKLTVTGGIDPVWFLASDVASSGAYYEAAAGQNAATSGINTGRLRFNATTKHWEISEGGSLYTAVGTINGTSTVGYVPYWTGTTTLATSSIYFSSATGYIGIGTSTPETLLSVVGTTTLATTTASQLSLGNGLTSSFLVVDQNGKVTSTTSPLSVALAAATYPTFTYATNTFASFNYASSTFASTSFVVNNFPTFTYATNTFPSFTYASNTFASVAGTITNTYASSTFPSFTYATNTFVTYPYATSTFAALTGATFSGNVTVNGTTTLATTTASQLSLGNGLTSAFLAVDQNGKVISTTTANFVTNTYASNTFPTFTYATNTFATLANSVSYTYASSTFPSFTYASTTFASTSWVTATFVPYTYATNTFPTFSYASNTFASVAGTITNTYASSTFPSFTYATNTFVNYTYATNTFPSFTYATNTFATILNSVSYTYASSTFPSFTYATNTFATLLNSVSYSYASSTFPSFSYASSTFASTSFVTGNYVPYTGATSDVNLGTRQLTVSGTTTLATTTISQLSLGNGLISAILAVDQNGKIISTTTTSGITNTYASSTFVSFGYASSTFASTSFVTGNFPTFTYASNTFPSFTYATNTFATIANYPTYTYASTTFASTSFVTATFVPYTGATADVNLGTRQLTVSGTTTLATTSASQLTLGNGLTSAFLAVDQNGKVTSTTTPVLGSGGINQLAYWTSSGVITGLATGTAGKFLTGSSTSPSGYAWEFASSGSATVAWGAITGVLSDQTDLQDALNAKLSTTSAAATYVPYTGATADVNLGTRQLTVSGTTTLATTTASQLSLGNGLTSAFLAVDQNGKVIATTTGNFVTFGYASNTFPSFTYATNTFATLANSVSYTYASSTFPSFTYASTTFASTSFVTGNFPTFTYATNTFVTFSYATNTFATLLNSVSYTYASSTFPSFTYASNTFASAAGYVPYTGATTNVDLGAHNLTVDTNTLIVSASTDSVGIGVSPSATNKLYVVGNASGAGLFTYGVRAENTPSAGTDRAIGGYFQTQVSDNSTSTGYIAGVEGRSIVLDTATQTTAYGLKFSVENRGGGMIQNAYGVHVEPTMYGSATGTIQNAYGFYTNMVPGSGTINNSYGLYIASGAGTNSYGIYQLGGTKNYFATNVGIGTSTPVAKLDVYGTAGTADIFALSSSSNTRFFTVSQNGSTTIASLALAGIVRSTSLGSLYVDNTSYATSAALANYPTFSYATSTFSTYTYGSSTFPSFTYASNTFATIAGTVTNTYASNTFPTFTYATNTFVTYNYATSTFPSFTYASNTFASVAGTVTNTYASSTFPSFTYATNTFVTYPYATNTFAALTGATFSGNVTVNGTTTLATTTASQLSLGNGLTSAFLAVDQNGKVISTTTANFVTFTYASNTFPTFTYATNTFATLANSVSYTYASSTFASTSWVTATFVPYSYATNTFPTFSYASNTYASAAGYVPYTGATTNVDLGAHNLTVGGTTYLATSTAIGAGVAPDLRLLTLGNNTVLNAPQLRLIYGSGSSAIEILGNSASDQHVLFGSSASTTQGRITYSNSTNSLRFGTNNVTNLLVIDSSGRVGIASTTPTAKLTVVGTSGSTDNVFVIASSTNSHLLTIASNGSTTIASLALAGVVRSTSGGSLYVDNTSYVSNTYASNTFPTFSYATSTFSTYTYGSSTFPSFTYASNTFASVAGTVTNTYASSTFPSFTYATNTFVTFTYATNTFQTILTNPVTGTGSNGLVARWNSPSGITTGILMDNGTVAGVNATTSTSTFNVRGNAGTADAFSVASSSGASFLVVKASGNVGIGTTLPIQTLDVAGNLGVGTFTSSNGLYATSGIRFSLGGNATAMQSISMNYGNSSNRQAGSAIVFKGTGNAGGNQGGQITFQTIDTGTGGANLADRMIITDLGNVGIGTTSPLARLDIYNSGTQDAFGVSSSSNSRLFTIASNGSTTIASLALAGVVRSTSGGSLYVDNTSYVSNTYASNTFPTFSYATSTFSTYTYGSSTFPSFTYASNTFASVAGTVTNTYASSTFVNYTYATNTFSTFTYGSSTFPSFTYASNTFATGTNYWSANGANIYNVNSGKVGIGTTTPQFTLDVAGTIHATGSITIDSLVGSSNAQLSLVGRNVGVANTATIFANQNGHLIINDPATGATGNVVIGANNSSGAKFQVVGSASVGTAYAGITTPTNGLIVQGTVGIGTTTPVAKLDIYGTSSQPTTDLFAVSSSSNARLFTIAANGSTTLSSLALAGIVRSTSAGSLYVDNTSYVSNTYASNTFPSFTYASTTFASTSWVSATFVPYSYATNTFPSFTYASNTYALAASSSQWITNGTSIYYNTGNVGVGTSTPSARLSVTGTAGTLNDIFTVASSTETKFFTVTSAGNVGVGTSSPAAKLAVNGKILTNSSITFSTDISKVTTPDLYRNNGNLFFKERQLNAFYERTITNVSTAPADYDTYYEIGTFAFSSLQGLFTIELTFSGGGYGQAGRYIIPTSYNNDYLSDYSDGLSSTTAWIVAEGNVQTPRHKLGNATDWELQYKITNNSIAFRLVIKGSNGESGSATALVKIYHSDDFTNSTYTENTATGTDATDYERLPSIVSAPIGRTLIQNTLNVIGSVGIGTTSPVAKLDVYGTAGTADIFALSSSSNARFFTVSQNGSTTIASLAVAGFVKSASNGSLYVDNNTYISNTYASSTFPSFTYASNTYASAANYVSYTYASSTFPSFTYASNTFATGTNYWSANGANIYNVNSGNVGIGTTTPLAKLEVYGTAGNNAIANFASSSNTSALYIAASGNVGFGTTNPGHKIEVAGNILVKGVNGYDAADETGAVYFGDTNHGFQGTHSRGVGIFTFQNPNGIVLSQNVGRVGIGASFSVTDTAAGKLLIDNNASSTDKALIVRGHASQVANLTEWQTSVGNVLSAVNSSGSLGLGTSTPSTRLDIYGVAGSGDIFGISSSTNVRLITVSTKGYLGIGTSTPTAKLSVSGTSGSIDDIFVVASSTNARLFTVASNGSTTIASLAVAGFVKSASNGSLYVDNNTYISNTYASSTFPSFTYATNTFVTYSYATNTFQTILTNPVTGTGSNGLVARWNSPSGITTGILMDNGTVAGVNATSSSYTFNVQGGVATNPLRVASSSSTIDPFVVVTSAGNVGIGTAVPVSLLTIGTSTEASTPRQTITINPAGYAAPSAGGTTSIGDKLVWWNSASFKAAMGMAAGEYWFQSGGLATHFSFYGGDISTPAELLRLYATGGLSLGGTFVGTDPGAGNFILSGRLGVGTSTPVAKLDVYGAAGTADIFALSSSSNARFFTVSQNGSTTIASLALAGIVRSTSGGSLYVDNTSYVSNTYASNTFPSFTYASNTFATLANSVSYTYASSTFPSFTYASTTFASTSWIVGNYVPYIGATTNVDLGAHNLTVDTNVLFVNAGTDRVGIGTTTPNDMLEIGSGSSGRLLFGSSGGIREIYSSEANPRVQLGRDVFQSGQSGLMLGINGNQSIIGVDSNGTSLLFSTGATLGQASTTERMRITSTGNVGIGTTTPLAKLNVLSTTEQLRLSYDSANKTSFAVASDGTMTVTSGNGATVKFGNLNSELLIRGLGSISHSGAVFNINAASQPLQLQSSGQNVGIASATPSAKLTVKGTSGSTNDLFVLSSSTDARLFTVASNGSTTIASLALAGIVRSTSLGSLYIDSNTYTSNTYASNTFPTFSYATNTFSTYAYGSSTYALSASSSQWITNGTSIYYNTGNVGIGTTTPEKSLTVSGAIMNYIGDSNQISIVTSTTTGAWPQQVIINGKFAYVANRDGFSISILDISNPKYPRQISTTSVQDSPDYLAISGKYLYVANEWSGLSVVDVSNPRAPIEIATLSSGGHPFGTAISGHYVYMANGATNDVSVIDVSNPYKPKEVKTATVGGSPLFIAISGRYAYVTNNASNTISVLDISDPLATRQIATTSVTSSPEEIAVSGSYAYVVAAGGIAVVDISNPSAPVQVSTVSAISQPNSIAVSFRHAYTVNEGGHELQVFDISNPLAPFSLGYQAGIGQPAGVAVSGHYVYTTAYSEAKLYVLDVGGIDTGNLLAGAIEAGNINVQNDISTGGFINAGTALSVGIGGIFSSGVITAYDYMNFSDFASSTFLGYQAGKNVHLSALDNTFVGYRAGYSSSTAPDAGAVKNTALGSLAFSSNTTGDRNVAVGYSALKTNTIGETNVAVGVEALLANTEGNSNTAVGDRALATNITGTANVAIGYAALDHNATGSSNVAMGGAAMFSNIGGGNNIGIGYQTLYTNTYGSENVGIGAYTLDSNITGSNNTAIGYDALSQNATGSNNTAVGRSALQANQETQNSAFGNNALSANTWGTNNSAFGQGTLVSNVLGINNSAFGSAGLLTNTGDNNTGLGAAVLYYQTTGDNNTALGYGAGRYQADGSTPLDTSSNSIYIGSDARGLNNSDSNSIVIGYQANGIGANTVVLGNDSIATTALKGFVGIGTTTPETALSVVGTSTTQGLRIRNLANTVLGVDALGNVIATTTSGGALSGGTTGWLTYWTSPTTVGAVATGTAGQFLRASSTSATGYDWSTPSGSLSGGQVGRNAYWTSATTLSFGTMFDNGSVQGINATSSAVNFVIQGTSGNFDPFIVASSSGTTTGTALIVKQSGNVGIGSTTASFADLSILGKTGTSSTNVMAIYGGTGISGIAGSGMVFKTGNGSGSATAGATGGDYLLVTGIGAGGGGGNSGRGGNMTFTVGNGGPSGAGNPGAGGSFIVTAGSGGTAGAGRVSDIGGAITLVAGVGSAGTSANAGGTGGVVTIVSGNAGASLASGANGGNILVMAGVGSGTGVNGRIAIGNNNPLGLLDIGSSTRTNIVSATSGSLINESGYTTTDITTASSATAVGMTFNAFSQQTLASLNASTTYTNLYGTYLGGAPTISGPILSVGSSTALYIDTKSVTASTSKSYGLVVNAQSGATNNYAAVFLGGNVGIGTVTPNARFEVASSTGGELLRLSSASGGGNDLRVSLDPAGGVIFNNIAITGADFTFNAPIIATTHYGATTTDGSLTLRGTSGSGASSRVNIQPTEGFVNIGTSTANVFLQVQGVSGSTNALFDVASSSGSSYLSVLSNGNVGVGTNAPLGKFSVITTTDTAPDTIANYDSRHATFGPSTADAVAISKTAGGSGYITSLQPGVSWNSLAFQASDFSWNIGGGPASMVIDGSGRVGIGKTPSVMTEINGHLYIGTGAHSGGDRTFEINEANAAFSITDTGGGHKYMFTNLSAGDGSMMMYDETVTAARWLVTSTGLMGIGTTTPNTLLSVAGTSTTKGLKITDLSNSFLAVDSLGNVIATTTPGGGVSGGQVGRNAYWTSASTLSFGTMFDNGSVQGINATSGAVNFVVQGTAGAFDPFIVASSSGTTTGNYFIVKQSGNVGIGTSSPSAKLSVAGATAATPVLIVSGAASQSGALQEWRNSAGTVLSSISSTTGTFIGDISLTMGDGAGVTSSGSGMEAGTGGTGLIQGCANNEVLKWNDSTSVWACGSSSYLKYITVTPVNVLNDTGNTADQGMTDEDVTAETSNTATAVALQVNFDYSTQNAAIWHAHVAPNGVALSIDNIVCGLGDDDLTGGLYGCGNVIIVDLDANQIFDWGLDELAGTATTIFRINVIGYWDSVTTGADLAEYYYSTDSTIRPGDVVSLDPDSPEGIRKSTGLGDETVIGVVSTEPGMVLGTVPTSGANGVQVLSETDAENLTERTPVPVALAGRIPVNVSIENGPIKAGDLLTPSSIPGVAMKATKAGRIIGQALFGHDKEEIGAVMMFVNNTYFQGQKSQTFLAGLEYQNSSEELGKVILTKMLNSTSTSTTTDPSNISEIFTDRLMAGLEVITPKVITDTIDTRNIFMGSNDGKLYFTGFSTTTGTTSTAITFDNSGNAFFAGNITANKITANSIEGLEIISDKISSLSSAVLGMSTSTETWVTKDSLLALITSVDGLSASSTSYENRLSILESQMNNFASVFGIEISTTSTSTASTSILAFLENIASTTEDLTSSVSVLGEIGTTTADLTSLMAAIQTENQRDALAYITDKIVGGSKLLTDFVALRITAVRGYIDELFAKKIHTEQVCVKKSDNSEVCINGDQLQNIIDNTGTVFNPGDSGTGATTASTTEETATTTESTATTTEETATTTESIIEPTATTTEEIATTTESTATTTESIASSTPVTPSAPNITSDDEVNTVSGMTTGLEYNLDGAGYVAYADGAVFNAIDFSGDHVLNVRVADDGINGPGYVTPLVFTAN